MATPAPSEIALPGDEPVSHAARRAEAHDRASRVAAFQATAAELREALLDAQGECDDLRGRVGFLREELDRRDNLHAQQVSRLKGHANLLESLLDELDEDWRLRFECPRCEDELIRPDAECCTACERKAEGDWE